MLELVPLVNCEGHLFVADFVAVADSFLVDKPADNDVAVVEKTEDSGAVRSVGRQRLDTRWF